MEAAKVFSKLRLDKANQRLIVNAPKEFIVALANTTFDEQIKKKKEGKYDFVIVFATTQAELEKLVKEVATAGTYDCVFWAGYPKLSGTIKSDIKRETVWIAFDLIGLQAVTSVAIDETWTALRARPIDRVGK